MSEHGLSRATQDSICYFPWFLCRRVRRCMRIATDIAD